MCLISDVYGDNQSDLSGNGLSTFPTAQLVLAWTALLWSTPLGFSPSCFDFLDLHISCCIFWIWAHPRAHPCPTHTEIFQTNPLLSLIKKIIVSRWWKGFPLVSKRNRWRCISEERGWEAIIFAGSRLQKNRLIMGDDYDNPYHHQDQHCHHHNFHNCHQSPSRIIAL